ncbi:MAG: cytochrome P450 [Chloroflexota bacterium]|nr:cytochrome P450 [Chloroflexota bacterium]
MTATNNAAPADAPVPTGVAVTALDPAFQRDPDPVLDDLRQRDPVHHDEQLARWLLTRHDDVDALLRDRTLSADPRNGAPGTFMSLFSAPDGQEPSILFLDAPEHDRLRGLVSKAFTPRAVEQMRPRIQQIVDDLLDAVADTQSFDLIGAFAGPLPTIVIAEMLGVDPADRVDFKRWSDDGVMAFDPLLTPEMRERVMASNAELEAYFRRAIAERRAEPKADLISSLIAVEEDGVRLTDEEMVTMCALLLAAGNVTTTDLIGNGTLALLQNPDQFQKLREAPELIRNAVEEMLRYDSPVVETGRIPLEAVEIRGCPIGARESIVPVMGAANHDPEVYPDPHRFDVTRADTHHQSFGGGIHFCLGAPLARLEAQLAINALVQRFPRLHLGDEPLEYRRIPGFRGLVRLNVLA